MAKASMIAAIVPAKPLDQAKGRLSAVLNKGERRALALAMLEDILRALGAVPRLHLTAVVSPDAEVLARARDQGAEAIAEPPAARGINQALRYAVDLLAPRGLDGLLVILGDVPAVQPAEVEAILDALPPERGVVLCPSLAQGTSALALRPPSAIPFRFGRRSFRAHQREALALGLPCRVLRIDSLAADIDGSDDLSAFISRPGDTSTHRFLGRIGLAERLQAARRR